MKQNAILHRLGLLVAVLLSALLLLPAAVSAAPPPQYADAVGGTGGNQFKLSCGGDALVGFELHQGDAVNALGVYCAALHNNGGASVDPGYYLRGNMVGGDGGRATNVMCPPNHVVLGLKVTSAGRDANNIDLVCIDIALGRTKTVRHEYESENDVGYYPKPTICPETYIATGAFGNASDTVRNVGLKCEQNPFAFHPQENTNDTANTSGAWSAFAAAGNGNWGFAIFQDSEQTASKLALNGCGGSGKGCKVFWTTQDTCVAYADTPDPEYIYAAGGGPTEQAAIDNALKFCQSGQARPGSCIIQKSGCR